MDTVMMIAFPTTILILGMLGGLLTSKQIPTWYSKLNKPRLNPPNWIFGPMWTLIYILIGVSGYLVWKETQSFSNTSAWVVYFMQLTLNYAWTPLFFYYHLLFISLIEILAMAVTILINIVVFYNINQTAGLLLIPYIMWVSFASYLTYSIWSLNRNNASAEKKSLVH